ncbi:hypothetical protein MTR67_043574 [Solanum verrucosum]|uniref:Uncharacterized protein n=1 Tax=Solanum verrucosum TaxID=315347 RepID=A0AAF0URY2_SOLVR|nr:hypothetical protein MTR67_043574 [Solanum verrucosum]
MLYIVPGEKDIGEAFPDELVMIVTHCNPPWYADFANYVVCGILPDGLNFYQRKSNEGKNLRQGYSEATRSEKVEEKPSWYMPKLLGKSSSGPSASLKFQLTIQWTKLTWLADKWFGDMLKRSVRLTHLPEYYRKIW